MTSANVNGLYHKADHYWCCVECTSKRVRESVYVDLNTGEITTLATDRPENDTWCDDCNAPCEVMLVREFTEEDERIAQEWLANNELDWED